MRSDVTTRILGTLSIATLALLAVMALVVTPADVNQLDAVRLIYIHVPIATVMYVAFGVTALGSILYLLPRTRARKWDILAGAMLRDDPARFSAIYRLLLHAARAESIGPGRLPDFLGLEHGGELALLGQEELDISVLEAGLRD